MMPKDNAPAAGHNAVPNGVAADHLRSIVERIERLKEEKQALQGDITDIYGEAKGKGFDTRAIREIVKLRAEDKDKRQEREAVLDVYLAALGML